MTRYYVVAKAKKVLVEDGQEVKSGQIMYIDMEDVERQAAFDGTVSLEEESSLLKERLKLKKQSLFSLESRY